MERILQGGMEQGCGTGVWNGCGPGACSGPPILTCTHIAPWLSYSFLGSVGANMMPSKADLKRSPESLSKDNPIQIHRFLMYDLLKRTALPSRNSYPKKHIKTYHVLTIHIQTNINKNIKQKLQILNHPLLTQNYHSSITLSPPEAPHAPGFGLFSEHLWVVDSLRLDQTDQSNHGTRAGGGLYP